MDLAKARAFNSGRNFSLVNLAIIATALGGIVTPAQVATWSDTILAGVASWQSRNGLTADGAIGPLTFNKMKGAASERRFIPNFIHEAAAQFPGYRFGSDISLWNPDIEPTKMQGVSFIILKATEGDFTDPLYLQHRATLAKNPQVRRGNYHLPRMVNGTKGDWVNLPILDPVAQAKYSAGVAKTNPTEFGEWMDMEPDSVGHPKKKPRFSSALLRAYGGKRDKLAAWVKSWLDVFENESGVECGCYWSPRLAKEGGEELRAVIGHRRRWIAMYATTPKLPLQMPLRNLDSWGEAWDIWQCRGSDNKETLTVDEGGLCLGIGGGRKSCDQNALNPASSLMGLLAA